MAVPESNSQSHLIAANDKLLKALIAVLALKDEHLMEELQIVFAFAGQQDNAIGCADAPTWDHVRKELRMISDLVEREAALERAH